MTKVYGILGIAVLLAVQTSGAVLAQSCQAGYTLVGGVCQVTAGAVGAIAGGAVGAAGAIAGGALNATGNVVGGTARAVTGTPPSPAPTCSPGYTYYNGSCYPAR